MNVRGQLLTDVAEFARLATASTDLDPTYPVLRRIQSERGLSAAGRAWSSVCFVGYYRLTSALQAQQTPGIASSLLRDQDGPMLRLGTGVERRGLRTPSNMFRHWQSVMGLIEAHGSVIEWLQDGFTASPVHNWTRLRENYGRAWGNGRWATYKLAEVLREVNGWNLYPPDMGNDGSTGPVAGLHLLFGDPPPMPKADRIANYDSQGMWLMHELSNRGVRLNLAQVETVLCDFHNLYSGAYYVGHDIDVMLHDLRRPDVPARVANEVFYARQHTLPHDYLGELRGWTGVDRDRCRVYRIDRKVIGR